MKRALITGITGQDGSYMAELLLSKGYEVHGIIRRASTFNTQRIEETPNAKPDPRTATGGPRDLAGCAENQRTSRSVYWRAGSGLIALP